MTKKRRSERVCDCISYGKIEPKKLERLQKSRQRQMCTWRDIAPFSERHEYTTTNTRPASKLLFPPIYELPCITNPDAYRAMYNTGGSELLSDEIHANNGRVGEENKATSHHYGCSSALRSDNLEEDENGFTNSDCKESRSKTEQQSTRLKLPKLTNFNVVNQRL